MTRTWRSRLLLATALGVGVLIGGPALASAHVTVNPNSAAAGSYATLTFKVPTESATASTTRLEVDLPTDHPFGSVSYQPVAGWTTSVTTSTLATPITTDDGVITKAPTTIVWRASAGAVIKPGQFQTFLVSVGPVPDTGSVRFTAHQTYSDGSVVDWDQAIPASGAEPEHPAPVLYINTAVPGDPHPSASTAADSARATEMRHVSSTNTRATWYAVGGIALGAIALVVAVYGLGQRRRA